MSPEQAAGRLGRIGPVERHLQSGATLYTLLTGHPPIEASDVGEILRKAERGEFPRPRQVNPQVPAPLEAICLKAMVAATERPLRIGGSIGRRRGALAG